MTTKNFKDFVLPNYQPFLSKPMKDSVFSKKFLTFEINSNTKITNIVYTSSLFYPQYLYQLDEEKEISIH